MNKEKIQTAIQSTFENAQRFLEDSKALQERGSFGHATSLAILGYEEAMKSFELTKFHPFYDAFYSEEDRKILEEQLFSHAWKQNSALKLRVALESILDSGIISEEDRIEVGFPSKTELVEGTEFAFSEKLNDMKNDGFYVDASRNPFWFPQRMNETFVKFAQQLLSSQLDTVRKVVEILSQLNEFPDEVVKQVKEGIVKLVSTLKLAEEEGVKELDELERRLAEHGIEGKIVSSLARSFFNDEKFRKIVEKK